MDEQAEANVGLYHYNAEYFDYFLYKPWRPKGVFFNLKLSYMS